MPESNQLYTYRGGVKVSLEKREDQVIVRSLPDELADAGIANAEQVSSASSRVDVPIPVQTPGEPGMPELAVSPDLGRVDPAYYEAASGQEFLPTDRILVTFKAPPSDSEFNAFIAKYALIEREHYSDRDYLFQMTENTELDPVSLVVKLMEDEAMVEVADHDLNYRANVYAVAIPIDPQYVKQWHLHTRLNDPQFDQRASSRCEDAWQILNSYGSETVVVGVTDDGCLLEHQDFDSSTKFAGWGYFQGTSLITRESIGAQPQMMYQQNSNHGTACAGVIAGEADSVLTVGAAPGCRLLPIKWESDGPSLFISDSKLLTAINYLADKVDVISNSWGVVPRSNWSAVVKNRIAELAQRGGRRGKGIVFFWAAGNENCPFHHSAQQNVPYTSGWSNGQWVGVRTSSSFSNGLVGIPGVMHVAALASNAQRSHYSNYGTGIGICAPTNNVHEYHRIRVTGLGITTTSGTTERVTSSFGGTSSATPLVAGIAALVISANPGLTAIETISLLKRTASKELNFDNYPKTPPAAFDPNPSWDVSPVVPFNNGTFQNINSPDGTWSPWFGHGRVDAAAAVAEAVRLRDGENPGEGDASTIKHKSSPNLPIPDNNITGINDVIEVAKEGKLKDISISIDIEHSWIGDLSIILIAPDGTSVPLHHRSGANTKNLVSTYSITKLPALATLSGRSVAGNWTLNVRDLASQDTGILKDWEIILKTQTASLIVEDVEAVVIPDGDIAGITRTLRVRDAIKISKLVVAVDITHTWIGDLKVSLVPPDGQEINLHNRSGGSADNLIRTWTSADSVELQEILNTEALGSWQLKVADVARQDKGKLNKWSLEITP